MSFITDTFFGGSEKKAGKVQAEASEAAVAEQRRQFDITQQQLQPFVSTGVDALEQQRILLGLGASTPAQQAPQLGSFAGPIPGFGAGPGGIRIPQLAGVTAPRTGVTIDGATGQVESGLSPLEQQQQAFAAFGDSPGQRFLRERGERALLRNASAIGGLGGGNVRSALQQQGIGFAAQDFQNQLNRLASLSGGGQVTATNLGQFGAQAAGQIGQGLQQAGAARASGILGSAEAKRSTLGSIAQFAAFSDIRLKGNLRKVGELDSGLAWHEWDWTEEAKALVGDQATEGVIAQEAKEFFPHAIGESDGFLTVNYAEIH